MCLQQLLELQYICILSLTVFQFQWNHFDDVLNIWLPCMEMEQQVVLREAYIDSIDLLIAAMGFSSVRWSRKLLNVLSEYCENNNTEDKALQVSDQIQNPLVLGKLNLCKVKMYILVLNKKYNYSRLSLKRPLQDRDLVQYQKRQFNQK